MSQTTHKTYLPLATPGHFIEVRVSYSKGGMCYSTYKTKPRGYYLSAGPVEREDVRNGLTVTTYSLGSHNTWLLAMTKRFSAKDFAGHTREVEAQVAAKSGPHWNKIASMYPFTEIAQQAIEAVQAAG